MQDFHDVLEDYISRGYDHLGYIPIKFGPSGKTLSIELIFNKKD